MIKRGRRFLDFLERYPAIQWLAIAMTLLYCATQYEPPTKITKVYPTTPVRAGQEVSFEMDVERDSSRKCSVEVSRYFMDSAGYRSEYISGQYLNAQNIQMREQLMGSKLKIRVRVPVSMSSGPATIHTTSRYRCSWNLLHLVWPIEQNYVWDFEVLPPLTVKVE